MDLEPTKIAIVKAVTRQGDPDQKTETELYTAYWIKVWAPGDNEWVVEKRFTAFKALKKRLEADGNPAIRGLEFPASTTLGSITGQGLDVQIVHTRKRLLENWLTEALAGCPGDEDFLEFQPRH